MYTESIEPQYVFSCYTQLVEHFKTHFVDVRQLECRKCGTVLYDQSNLSYVLIRKCAAHHIRDCDPDRFFECVLMGKIIRLERKPIWTTLRETATVNLST